VFTDTTRFRVKEIEVFEIQNDCAEILLNEGILNDELFDEEEIATLISQASITRDRAIEALRNASREPDPSKMFFTL
jgi:NACalpha-BTF3-like transcription factor